MTFGEIKYLFSLRSKKSKRSFIAAFLALFGSNRKTNAKKR